jgi:hypothetical protein
MSEKCNLIDQPHHVSKVHPQMSMMNRAAQFSPFAALTGHEDALRETARLTDRRIELDEESKAALDWQLQLIQEKIDEHPMVTITYFVPDTRKSGGKYTDVSGNVKKLDPYAQQIVLTDGTGIPLDEVIQIIFKETE